MIKLLAFTALLGALLSCGKSSSGKPPKSTIKDPATASPESSPAPEPTITQQYLSLVNRHRLKLGLRPVEASPIIEEVALGHSEAMARGWKFFGHSGWRGRCRELRNSLKGNLCGEIVAMGQRGPKEVFQAWLNSPPHRKVIEGENFTHTGLGYMANSYGRIYWTQLFLQID